MIQIHFHFQIQIRGSSGIAAQGVSPSLDRIRAREFILTHASKYNLAHIYSGQTRPGKFLQGANTVVGARVLSARHRGQ